MSDKTQQNIADMANQGEKGKKKEFKNEMDYKKEVEKETKGLPFSKKFKIWVNSFKKQYYFLLIVFYIIPLFLMLGSLFSNMLIFYFNFYTEGIDKSIVESIQSISDISQNIYSGYINIFNFAWLSSLFGFDSVTIFNDILSVVQNPNDEQYINISKTLVIFYFVYTTLTFLVFLVLFLITEKFFKTSDRLDKLVENLIKSYNISGNNSDETKIGKKLTKKEKLQIDLIKEIKLLKEQGKSDVYLKIKTIPILEKAFEMKDSGFVKELTDILMKNIQDKVEKQITIKSNEELFNLLFENKSLKGFKGKVVKSIDFGFNPKEFILSDEWYNNYDTKEEIYTNLSEKEKEYLDNLPKEEKEEILEMHLKELKKEKIKMIKLLFMLSVMYNLPFSVVFKYLEKNGMKITNEQKQIIYYSRKIALDRQKKSLKQIIVDTPLKLMFPPVKEETYKQLEKIFIEYITVNVEQTDILLSKKPETDDEDKIQIFKISFDKYLNVLTEAINKFSYVLLTDERFKTLSDNFNENVKRSVIDYFEVSSTEDIEQNKSILSRFQNLRLDDFIAISNMLLKKEAQKKEDYTYSFEPLYMDIYKKLNVEKELERIFSIDVKDFINEKKIKEIEEFNSKK